MTIAKSQPDLDKRTLATNKLNLHIGMRESLECLATFDEKYSAKHGSCSDHVMATGGTDPRVYFEYKERQEKVFVRYARLWEYYRVKQRTY